MRLLVFAAALYLLTPGHPDIPLSGIPLGQAGATLLIALLVSAVWTRDVSVPVRPLLIRALGVAVAVKFTLALVVPQLGWLTTYYSNDQFAPPARQSLEFHVPGSTRIDRQIAFEDTSFPVHFFNELDFNYGFRREATEPFSALWRGHVDVDAPLHVAYQARGPIEVAVDGVVANDQPFTVPAGKHLIDVRYRKARDIEGAINVSPLDDAGQPRRWAIGEVSQIDIPKSQRSIAANLAPVAWLAHALALVAIALGASPVIFAKLRQLRPLPLLDKLHHTVAPIVIAGLTAQGLWKSRHMVGGVWTLSGGDDWFAFEAQAREALLNGWLIQAGAPPGEGLPFNVYPGYSYFVAAVHWLTGESMAGVILANFVVLALATVLVHAMALRFTTRLGALFALAWLMALQQLDFVRYYTVTLLSENLYFVLVALTLYCVIRFCRGGSMVWIALGGLAAGAGATTRPTMLLFMPIAAALAAVAMFTARRYARAIAAPLLFAVACAVPIAPITYRNIVMSGDPVLITAGQAQTFIQYNLPDDTAQANMKYVRAFTGTNLSAAKVLLLILWDHPAETLRNWGIKAGFALGMVHWMGSGTPHPELILTTAAYLLAIALVRTARSLSAWLVHAFIFTHLITLLLTMPSNYGYRMVLAMYLVMVIFAGALVAQLIEGRAWERSAVMARG